MINGLMHVIVKEDLHDKAERDRDDALIIAAGPGAGLLLGLVTWVVAWVSGVREPGTAGGGGLAASIVGYLLWINVVWSFVNLLPLWPLDGGQLFRLGMLRLTKPARAEQVAFSVGAGLAGLGAVLSYRAGFVFFTVICALLAWENIQRLMDGRAGGAIRTGHQVIHGLLREARAALEAGDPREAARLTHQVRAEDSVHRGLLPEIWSILAVATVALGEHDEALAYIKRAPRTPEVVAAAIRCYAALGEPESARAELADPAFRKLPVPVQMELRGLIDRS